MCVCCVPVCVFVCVCDLPPDVLLVRESGEVIDLP